MNLITLSQKNFTKFIVLWVFLSAIYYLALAVAANAVPKRIEWTIELILPASILAALAVSLIATGRSTQTETADEIFKNNTQIGLYGAVILVVIYMVSILLAPSYVTTGQLQEALNGAELTELQKQQILALLQRENYVSMDELQNMGLNSNQTDEVIRIVSSLGFVREEEVIGIVRTETANMATATAVAIESTCFVGTKYEYASVSVRQDPRSDIDNAIAYLARGEKVKVIGYTTVDGNLWWQVELSHGIGLVQGWIISWPVEVSNEVACNKVPNTR